MQLGSLRQRLDNVLQHTTMLVYLCLRLKLRAHACLGWYLSLRRIGKGEGANFLRLHGLDRRFLQQLRRPQIPLSSKHSIQRLQ